jgi:hypothetical protein
MFENFIAVAVVALGMTAVVVLFGAVLAFPVMWLWNGVLPNLFAANVTKPINFWDAWGLLILCGLLFKGADISSK